MFAKLAKFRLVQLRCVTPPRCETVTYSNDNLDNLPGFRRLRNARRNPASTLSCHWRLGNDNRLSCGWHIEIVDETVPDDPDWRSCVSAPGIPALHTLASSILAA